MCDGAAGAERFEFRSQEENNMMLLLSRAGLRYNEKDIALRTDRSPGWCRAGGGLLGGKDPAGRFALVVVTAERDQADRRRTGHRHARPDRPLRSKSRFSGRSGVLGRDSFSSRARFAGSSGRSVTPSVAGTLAGSTTSRLASRRRASRPRDHPEAQSPCVGGHVEDHFLGAPVGRPLRPPALRATKRIPVSESDRSHR